MLETPSPSEGHEDAPSLQAREDARIAAILEGPTAVEDQPWDAPRRGTPNTAKGPERSARRARDESDRVLAFLERPTPVRDEVDVASPRPHPVTRGEPTGPLVVLCVPLCTYVSVDGEPLDPTRPWMVRSVRLGPHEVRTRWVNPSREHRRTVTVTGNFDMVVDRLDASLPPDLPDFVPRAP